MTFVQMGKHGPDMGEVVLQGHGGPRNGSAGEKLVGQRTIVAQQPARTADAPGGVRALTAATDAAIEELEQWLQQQPARQP